MFLPAPPEVVYMQFTPPLYPHLVQLNGFMVQYLLNASSRLFALQRSCGINVTMLLLSYVCAGNKNIVWWLVILLSILFLMLAVELILSCLSLYWSKWHQEKWQGGGKTAIYLIVRSVVSNLSYGWWQGRGPRLLDLAVLAVFDKWNLRSVNQSCSHLDNDFGESCDMCLTKQTVVGLYFVKLLICHFSLLR